MTRLSAPTRRSIPVWLALSAALAVLLVLIYQCPARWLAPWVQQQSGGFLQLQQVRGTAWNGSAYLTLRPGHDSNPQALAWSRRLSWQLGFKGLNRLEIRLNSGVPALDQPWVWQVQWHPSGLEVGISDVDWRLPAAWLSGLGAPWNTLQPDGLLRIQTQQWRWKRMDGQWQPEGQITLTVQGMTTRLSTLRPLGDYQIRLQGGARTAIELITLHGPLRMTGLGNWNQGHLQFQGEAWADQSYDEAVLSNLLSVLGNRRGPRAILKIGSNHAPPHLA